MRRLHVAMLVFPTSQATCDRLTALFANIATVIGLVQQALGPLAAPIYWYLDRAQRRLIALVHRLESGTYRPRKPANPRPNRVRKPSAHPRLPQSHGWLTRHAGPDFSPQAQLLATYLNSPEIQALLALAPRESARILRPVARLLGLRLAILPPPTPRKPRPKKPRPRKPTAQQQREALWYPNVEGKPIDLYKASRDMDPARRRRRA